MIKIKNKSKCSGCHACFNICPKQCISMVSDNEGFLYPKVDMDKCINCGLCEKVCHVLSPAQNSELPSVYACYNLNEEVRAMSSSGGMFSLYADKILDQGGVVFGAAFDENLDVKHSFVDSKENLYKLCGSKYVQSKIGDTYKKAKDFLECGRPVLFSGTPCQISGLKSYLGKDYEHLYTQDIICHGVPTEKLWKKYLRHLEAIYKSEVNTEIQPSFRDKASGWLDYSVKVQLQNGTVHCESSKKDPFIRMFLSDKLLRPSCYSCSCKGLSRNSDITLADFWGVNKLMPDMFDNKGTSIVFVNTEKGKRLFTVVQEFCKYKEVSIEDAVKNNSAAYLSAFRPINRQQVIKKMDNCDFESLRRICVKRNLVEKIERKLYSKRLGKMKIK